MPLIHHRLLRIKLQQVQQQQNRQHHRRHRKMNENPLSSEGGLLESINSFNININIIHINRGYDTNTIYMIGKSKTGVCCQQQ
mmetsp:Transcript_53812/g.62141  ORF Transcript_53812/g.62141 Transcript_53812/m.62141 type:complete len:83 (+) Transcript_53812:429-677(+)